MLQHTGIARVSARTQLAELAFFSAKNALSCLFPASIFACLALLRQVPYRYDVMLVLCLAIQWWMVRTGLETRDEAKAITLFHVLGLAMEVHKVHIGSWAYPDHALTKVFGVPLYSGFMYASVASFMCQAWRHFDLRFEGWPRTGVALAFAALLYANFVTNHYIHDLRWPLIAATFVIFRKTRVAFTAHVTTRRMPMILAFFLIAIFVWFGENIGTYLGAWRYPHQALAWEPVHLSKVSSWFCLVIVSLVLVGELKRIKLGEHRASGVFSSPDCAARPSRRRCRRRKASTGPRRSRRRRGTRTIRPSP